MIAAGSSSLAANPKPYTCHAFTACRFEFFKHHYDGVDVQSTDFNVAKNYAMSLAVTTWRHVQQLQQAQLQQAQAMMAQLRGAGRDEDSEL